MRLCVVLFMLGLSIGPVIDDPVYAPLWLYQGTWKAQKKGKDTADEIANECKLIGKYFGCQQTVNGKLGALIVFVPREKAGQYYTQALLPDDRATGRGELEIDGDHWTYMGKDQEGDKTTYHRTTNIFTGKDNIHYEQSESTDGVHWTVTASGDESRLK